MTRNMDMVDRNAAVLRARSQRRSPSLPEGLLWQVLRTRPDGMKFRRQHPIPPYVADFYCAAAKLVIEIDGESHTMGNRPARDAARDHWMGDRGVEVIRFAAREVLTDLESVTAAILSSCRKRLPLHHRALRDGPPPHGGAMGRN